MKPGGSGGEQVEQRNGAAVFRKENTETFTHLSDPDSGRLTGLVGQKAAMIVEERVEKSRQRSGEQATPATPASSHIRVMTRVRPLLIGQIPQWRRLE